MKVHKVNHVEHHSNKDKLRTVQSHAKQLSDKIATTRILESPVLPAAHRQDKKSSAMIETTSMADIYFLGEKNRTFFVVWSLLFYCCVLHFAVNAQVRAAADDGGQESTDVVKIDAIAFSGTTKILNLSDGIRCIACQR